MKITLQLAKPYSILLRPHLLEAEAFLAALKKKSKALALITETHLEPFAQAILQRLETAGLRVTLLTFEGGEENKTRETKQALEDKLLAAGLGKDCCLLALGGGVVSDLVGFLGATYLRGVEVMYLPTTLLAMVDASIGGKTGVNTPFAKNSIGIVSQPSAVFIDPSYLKTLPPQAWTEGWVEMIKHALILDSSLFTQLKQTDRKALQVDEAQLTRLIYQSCCLKKQVVEQDEFDAHIRQSLNFGHTLGHAIEQASAYHVSHGQAVALGMVLEAYLSVRLGLASVQIIDEIEAVLRAYGADFCMGPWFTPEALREALKRDKKNLGANVHSVLLEKIGQVYQKQGRYSHPIPQSLLKEVIEWGAQRYAALST